MYHDLLSTDEPANREFWEHNGSWSSVTATPRHIPLYLWGDDAVYLETGGDKIMCITMGAIMDERKDSFNACWPLAIVRCDLWYKVCQNNDLRMHCNISKNKLQLLA